MSTPPARRHRRTTMRGAAILAAITCPHRPASPNPSQ
jgi:hypothetical protein